MNLELLPLKYKVTRWDGTMMERYSFFEHDVYYIKKMDIIVKYGFPFYILLRIIFLVFWWSKRILAFTTMFLVFEMSLHASHKIF
jgi:hypothetical protein